MIVKNFFKIIRILPLISLILTKQVNSNSTGAGGCDAGDKAGGTYHTILGGPLSGFGTSVIIGGTTLVPGEKFEVPTNQDVTIEVQGQYKGLLIRLQAADGTDLAGQIEPGDTTNFQVQAKCIAPVAGITHRNPTTKFRTTAIFSTVGVVGDVSMDVSIVSSGKFIYYSGYTLSVVVQAPVPAPIAPTPVAVPIAPTPVAVPIAPTPVAVPIAPTPVAVPIAPTPVAAPIAPTPVAAPITPAPLVAPVVPAPVVAPTTPAPITKQPTLRPTRESPVTEAPFKSRRRKPTRNGK
jgi:hypothetical protein